jgi:hypothetical protein
MLFNSLAKIERTHFNRFKPNTQSFRLFFSFLLAHFRIDL